MSKQKSNKKTENASADSASEQVLPNAGENEVRKPLRDWLLRWRKTAEPAQPAELHASVSSESTEEIGSSSTVAKFYQENPMENTPEHDQKPNQEQPTVSAVPVPVSPAPMSDPNSVSTPEPADPATVSATSADAIASAKAAVALAEAVVAAANAKAASAKAALVSVEAAAATSGPAVETVEPSEPSGTTEKTDISPEPEPFEDAIRRIDKYVPPAATFTPAAAPNVETVTEPEPEPRLSLSEETGPYFSYRLFAMEGSLSHDYQDAAAADPESGFAAIADGTTLGGFSEIVSQELVTRFVRDSCNLDQETERAVWWLETRKAWYAQFRARFNDASAAEQTRWDKGGSATFLGMRVEAGGTYHLHLVGDCSLLWLDSEMKTLLRIEGATTFNSHPAVLHTEESETPAELIADRITGTAAPGTVALLVTDALAKFLQETEPWKHDPKFGERLRTADKELLRDWLLPEKAAFRLDADDYTFLLLQFPPDPDKGLSQ